MSVIVCAVDLQETAHPVINVAASLARVLGARLELLHVVHLPPGLPAEYLSETFIVDVRQRAAGILEAKAAELRRTGVEVFSVVEMGLVDECLFKRARDANTRLLVLGTHARHGVADLFLGSVAERVVRAAPCPVVVVPPSAAGHLLQGGSITSLLKIVAGIDASPASDAALAWLRTLDGQRRCDIRLVHLYSQPREFLRLGIGLPEPSEPDPEVIAVLKRDLHAHVAEHFGRREVLLTVRPFWGVEEDLLNWEADVDAADLLVVGTGQGWNSVALATVRGAHRPVLCVPAPHQAPRPSTLAPVRTVLATTDFSELGNAALREAFRLLLPAGGQVILLHVAAPGPAGLEQTRRSELEANLQALVPHAMGLRGIRARPVVVADAAAPNAILQCIRREAPDVVVMASHGRSGVGRAVRGSVTESVVRASPRPVLVVPSPRE